MPRPSPSGRPGTHVVHPRALLASQRLSDVTMVDGCVIRGPDRQGDLDPDTGEHAVVPGETVYDGRCRIHPVPLNEDSRQVADLRQQTSRYYLRLPLGTQVGENQRVEVTAVHPTLSDPTLVGRVFRILDHTPRVFATDLRVTLREEPVP